MAAFLFQAKSAMSAIDAVDYNTKFIEFAQTNTEAALEFAQNCRA
jgi:hypothetical protein